jgi:hypothetical protein
MDVSSKSVRDELSALSALAAGEMGEALKGEGAAVATWAEIVRKVRQGGTANYRSGMPEFLSAGRLRLEDFKEKGLFIRGVEGLLDREGIPGLLQFRESAGVCCSGSDEELVMQAQLLVLRLLLMVHPRLLRFQVADMDTMGRAMQALIPFHELMKSEVVANGTGLEWQLENLLELVKQRMTTTLSKHAWLWEYNEAHPEAAEPYTLVLLASGRKGMTRKAAESFRALTAKRNAAHAGIYFIVCERGWHGDAKNNPDETVVASAWKDGLAEMGHVVTARVRRRRLTRHGWLTEDGRVITDGAKTELFQNGWLDTRDGGPSAEFQLVQEELSEQDLQTLQTFVLEQAKAHARPTVKTVLGEDAWWTGNTSNGICVPIGRQRGAGIQEFVLGEDRVVYNALVGGAVGSGKTVLLHDLIVNAACKYSPHELRMHLLDYKEGTEFSVYRNLPHVDTLSIGPSVEFGLDVLKGLLEELRNRGKKFKAAGVTNLHDYREVTGEVMPRHLVVIDEFQVLWADSTYGERASERLEDLVRRGRAVGFNFVLSTQSLRGANLSAAAKSNLALRICLRLSENDCMDFLGPQNTAPAKFTQAGEALYNEEEGNPSGNRFFQASYLSGVEVAKLVRRLRELAAERGMLAENPAIYESDTFEDPETLAAEAGAGMLAVGRKTGLRGRAVAFPIRGRGLRGVAILGGDCEKRDAVMECLLAQLKAAGAEIRELSDGKLRAETDRWQRWHDGEEAVEGVPEVYVVREADRMRDVQDMDVQNQIGEMLKNAPRGADALFLVSVAKYKTLRVLTGYNDDLLRGKLILDRGTLLDVQGPNLPIGETEGWWVGEGLEEGGKIKLCGSAE